VNCSSLIKDENAVPHRGTAFFTFDA